MISDSIKTKQKVQKELVLDIEKSAKIMIDALKKGKKILICGNGGSAADAQHFATELVIRFERNRKALSAIALTTDTSTLTACSNDFGYDTVYERQVEALGNNNDVLIGITTSGNSINIIKAFEAAKKKGIKTICLNGKDGGKIKDMKIDSELIIPAENTARIQESHIMIIHIWCKLIENEF